MINLGEATEREAHVLAMALQLAREVASYRTGYRNLAEEIQALYLRVHGMVYGDNGKKMLVAASQWPKDERLYGRCISCRESFLLDEEGAVPCHAHLEAHDCNGGGLPPREEQEYIGG